MSDTLRDYARLFIGPKVAAGVSQGLLALEENWRGPVALNGGIETTLRQWQALGPRARTRHWGNYRFRMGLLRAYYDAYVHRRLLYETELEEWALDTLRRAGKVGVPYALTRAAAILDAAYTSEVAQEFRVRLRAWCEQLADSLNDAIGLQSSVARHRAQSWGRGAFMDGIDLPLNDGPWLRRQLCRYGHWGMRAPSSSRWKRCCTVPTPARAVATWTWALRQLASCGCRWRESRSRLPELTFEGL